MKKVFHGFAFLVIAVIASILGYKVGVVRTSSLTLELPADVECEKIEVDRETRRVSYGGDVRVHMALPEEASPGLDNWIADVMLSYGQGFSAQHYRVCPSEQRISLRGNARVEVEGIRMSNLERIDLWFTSNQISFIGVPVRWLQENTAGVQRPSDGGNEGENR